MTSMAKDIGATWVFRGAKLKIFLIWISYSLSIAAIMLLPVSISLIVGEYGIGLILGVCVLSGVSIALTMALMYGYLVLSDRRKSGSKRMTEEVKFDCDKAKILGYIEQTPEQIRIINLFKEREIEIVSYIDNLLKGFAGLHPTEVECDKRWMSIAKTHIQQGFMAAVRAVARPKGDR